MHDTNKLCKEYTSGGKYMSDSFRSIADIVTACLGAALPTDDDAAALDALFRASTLVQSADEHKRLSDSARMLEAKMAAKTSSATESPLAEHFKKEEARRTDPWRAVDESCALRAANILRTHDLESCRRLFKTQAKAKASHLTRRCSYTTSCTGRRRIASSSL
eukprot:PhM_4_TR14133/c5_g2_i2/m.39446